MIILIVRDLDSITFLRVQSYGLDLSKTNFTGRPFES